MDGGQALNRCLRCSEYGRRELLSCGHNAEDLEGTPETWTRAGLDQLFPGPEQPLARHFKPNCPAVLPTASPSLPGEKPVAFWVGPAGIFAP